MKIYTKTGDGGLSSLANGQRVCKTDSRLQAYGTADELNSFVGLLQCRLNADAELSQMVEWIQNKLFNLGAALAQASGDWIVSDDITQLEQWMDQMQVDLPAFRGFVLPGGNETISVCHICRTITRRLERDMVGMFMENDQTIENNILVVFINRLSDFWFVLAQKCAKNEGVRQILWKK